MDREEWLTIGAVLASGAVLVVLLVRWRSFGAYTERIERSNTLTRQSNELTRQRAERVFEKLESVERRLDEIDTYLRSA